jgi:hypothetical protein
LAGKQEVGSNVRKGSEDKTAEVKSRMRNHNFRVREGEIPYVEDIEVDCPWSVSGAFGGASERRFNLLQGIQQGDGVPGVFHFQNGVEEASGIGLGSHRIGFVKFGGEAWARHSWDLEDVLAGAFESFTAVAQVRAQCNSSTHGKRLQRRPRTSCMS